MYRWNMETMEKVASIDDVNTRLPLAGGSMAKGSWINFDAQSAYNAHDGVIGGVMWNGASDSIKILVIIMRQII